MIAETGSANGKGLRESRDLLQRTKAFAVRVIHLVDRLPRKRSADVIGTQLMKSASSVGANYRAARRGRSPAEFCSKLGIVEEEADESVYWMELLIESQIVRADLLQNLLKEANEILAVVVASIRTARRSKPRG
jgi:four helix bundle protein